MKWLLRLLIRLGRAPQFIFKSDLAWHWRKTRPGDSLLFGMPAILVACVMVGVTLYASRIEETIVPSDLLKQAIAAKNAGKTGLADLYVEKAEPLDKGNGATQFENAQLLIAAGRNARALKIIQGITPTDNVGHPPAREMVIQALQQQLKQTLSKPETQSAAEAADPASQEADRKEKLRTRRVLLLRAIQAQCERLLQETPDNRLAQDQLAGLYLRQGRYDDACKMLPKLVEKSEGLRSLYAQTLAQADRPLEAMGQAKMAARYHRQKIDELAAKVLADKTPSDGTSEPTDAAKVKLARYHHLSRLCLCLTLSQDYRDAALLLISDLKKEEADDPVLRKLLVDVLLTWADSLNTLDEKTGELDEDALGYRLMVLEAALNYSGGDPRLLARIGAIAGTEGTTAHEARAALRKIAESSNANPIVHFALGISAMKSGDVSNAISHFQSANEKSPGTPAMMNNLAFTMAQEENADLDGAFKLISSAIKVAPQNAELHDTRGMILVKQKKWAAAEKNLRFAVEKGVQDMARTYQDLITTYQALGQQDQVEMYRRKLDETR